MQNEEQRFVTQNAFPPHCETVLTLSIHNCACLPRKLCFSHNVIKWNRVLWPLLIRRRSILRLMYGVSKRIIWGETSRSGLDLWMPALKMGTAGGESTLTTLSSCGPARTFSRRAMIRLQRLSSWCEGSWAAGRGSLSGPSLSSMSTVRVQTLGAARSRKGSWLGSSFESTDGMPQGFLVHLRALRTQCQSPSHLSDSTKQRHQLGEWWPPH